MSNVIGKPPTLGFSYFLSLYVVWWHFYCQQGKDIFHYYDCHEGKRDGVEEKLKKNQTASYMMNVIILTYHWCACGRYCIDGSGGSILKSQFKTWWCLITKTSFTSFSMNGRSKGLFYIIPQVNMSCRPKCKTEVLVMFTVCFWCLRHAVRCVKFGFHTYFDTSNFLQYADDVFPYISVYSLQSNRNKTIV